MKALNIESIIAAHAASVDAAQEAAKEFSIKYPDDFGSCGGAWIHVAFGRKTKIKNMCIAAGIIGDTADEMYGKRIYIFKYFDWSVKGYMQQNAGYKECAYRAYARKFEELTGIEMQIHTWCD